MLSLSPHIPVIESLRILQLPCSKLGRPRRCWPKNSICLSTSFIHLPSGVDFNVVRDSVILLERKPLPRLHLTTGATVLLECKVRQFLICHFTFKLKCGKGRTMAGSLTREWHKGNRRVEDLDFLAPRALTVPNGLKIGGSSTLSLSLPPSVNVTTFS